MWPCGSLPLRGFLMSILFAVLFLCLWILSSIVITLLGKRELVALLLFGMWLVYCLFGMWPVYCLSV